MCSSSCLSHVLHILMFMLVLVALVEVSPKYALLPFLGGCGG